VSPDAHQERPAPEPVGPEVAYDAMADAYAAELESNAWNALYERPGTIALLPAVADKDVLEVGCGSGALSAWLVRNGARVTGFDASAGMIRIARERNLPSAYFVVADLADPLDFLADQAFDVVVAGLVLHYLRDWVGPLRELRRVLRRDGTLVFSTHHPASDVQLSTSGDYFATEVIHDRWTKGGKDFDVSFWRRPLTAMFAAIAEAGFRVDCLSEPAPLDECRERFPEAWERLSTQPHFLFFRLTPHR
jgi:SAM-dependent methyltransferase